MRSLMKLAGEFDFMKPVKVLAVIWAFVYLLVGLVKSFTMGSIDFWSSFVLLLCMFVLPLPVTFVGFWLEKVAGILLLCSSLASLIVAVTWTSINALDRFKFFGAILLWTLPHLAFAAAYLFLPLAGRRRTDIDPVG